QTFSSINDLSNLSFASTSTINLDFTGSETVYSLWDSTTNQFAAPNTYTAAQLNSLFGVTSFNGIGSVTVTAVPEPSTVGLFGAAMLFGAIILRRRKGQIC
ncbi:MAG TPA: PEP-CTERM sorting domain-containing protein, partial [Chthoniobacterales bacterium]|nr:PEP-CTERM sorting domain-containing protein [Chthoniobacterales bacterium]